MATIYETTIRSFYNKNIIVTISAGAPGGAGSDFTIKAGYPYISWDWGRGNTISANRVVGSTCYVSMRMETAAHKSFFEAVVTSPEGTYFMEIKYGIVPVWRGMILADQSSLSDDLVSYWTITAVCGLKFIQGIVYDTRDDWFLYRPVPYSTHLAWIISKIKWTEVMPDPGGIVQVGSKLTHQVHTDNPIQQTLCCNYWWKHENNHPEFKDAYEVLLDILTQWNAVIYQYRGTFRMVSVDAMVDADVEILGFNADGSSAGTFHFIDYIYEVAQDETNKPLMLSGASFNFLPPLKDVKLLVDVDRLDYNMLEPYTWDNDNEMEEVLFELVDAEEYYIVAELFWTIAGGDVYTDADWLRFDLSLKVEADTMARTDPDEVFRAPWLWNNLGGTTWDGAEPIKVYFPAKLVQNVLSGGAGSGGAPLDIISIPTPYATRHLSFKSPLIPATGGELKFNITFEGAFTWDVTTEVMTFKDLGAGITWFLQKNSKMVIGEDYFDLYRGRESVPFVIKNDEANTLSQPITVTTGDVVPQGIQTIFVTDGTEVYPEWPVVQRKPGQWGYGVPGGDTFEIAMAKAVVRMQAAPVRILSGTIKTRNLIYLYGLRLQYRGIVYIPTNISQNLDMDTVSGDWYSVGASGSPIAQDPPDRKRGEINTRSIPIGPYEIPTAAIVPEADGFYQYYQDNEDVLLMNVLNDEIILRMPLLDTDFIFKTELTAWAAGSYSQHDMVLHDGFAWQSTANANATEPGTLAADGLWNQINNPFITEKEINANIDMILNGRKLRYVHVMINEQDTWTFQADPLVTDEVVIKFWRAQKGHGYIREYPLWRTIIITRPPPSP